MNFKGKNILEDIRNKAEKLLKGNAQTGTKFSNMELDQILHELEVYQIELELQNEELVKTQQELELSRDKYYDLFNKAPVGYITLDKDKNILEMNESTLRQFGYLNPADLKGKKITNYIDKDYQDKFYFHFQELINEKQKCKVELKLRGNNSKVFHARLESNLIEIPTEEEFHIHTALIDITDRIIAEEGLRKEKEKIDYIYENVPAAIFTLDENLKVLNWNKTAEEITGYSKEEVLGNDAFFLKYSFQELLNESDFTINKSHSILETIIQRKNGDYRLVVINIAEYYIENSDIKGYINSFKDITERKEIQAELLRFRAAVDNAADLIFILDYNSLKIEDINQTALEKLRYKRSDLISNEISSILPESSVSELLKKIELSKEKSSDIDPLRIELFTSEQNRIPVELFVRFLKGDNKEKYFVISARDISERIEFEEKLKLSEQRFRSIIEKTPVGICITNENGIFEYANDSYCQIYQYDREYLLGSHFTIVVPEQQRAYFSDLHDNFILGDEENEARGEWKVIGNYGRQINIIADAAKIIGADRKKKKVTFVIDITEMKRSEEALRKSEERFRLLTENAQDIIYRYNISGQRKFDYISPSIFKITGYKPDDFYKDNTLIRNIIHEEDRVKFDKMLEEKVANFATMRWLDNYGELKWIESRNTPILDREGNLIAIEGVTRDITKRKKSEEFQAGINMILEKLTLRNPLDEIWQNLISLVEDQTRGVRATIFLFNDDGLLETVSAPSFGRDFIKIVGSRRFDDLIGATRQAIESKSMSVVKDAMNDEGYEKLRNIIEYFNIRTIWSMPIMTTDKKVHGTINFYWDHVLSHKSFEEKKLIESSSHISGIAIELKNYENALLEAKNAAEIANRAKSDFLANMSHEIRTPMNAVLGFAELLKDKNMDYSKYDEYLNGIMIGGKNLLNLINDILDLSKIEANKLDIVYEPVNIPSLIYELSQIFYLKIRDKNLEFISTIDPNLPEGLFLDEVRLRQVLFNLVGNAVKFTDKGYLAVNVKAIRINEKSVDVQIAVKDSGIGIPEDQQEIIFEPFSQREGQSARKYGGTGLGLAITKRLVEMMNGQIVLNSRPGIGSEFIVTINDIKIAFLKENPPGIEEQNNGVVDFEQAKVLMVEDISSNREVLKGYLENYKFEIFEAENGVAAIEIAKKINPDIIFMDMQMPEMDGYDATLLIKRIESLKKVPIIALTASAMKNDENDIKAITDGYIRKPASKKEIIEELKKHLKYKIIEPISQFNIIENKLSIEQIKELPSIIINKDLIKAIEEEIIKEWEQVSNTLIINKINDFAATLKEFASGNELEYFKIYADELFKQLSSFNIEKIIKLLPLFPIIKSKYKGE